MNLRHLLSRVRWSLLLPLAMALITTSLIVLAAAEDANFSASHPHWSDTPYEIQPPARFFVQVLNGPVFFLAPAGRGRLHVHALGVDIYELPRLLGIVPFWAWMGWLLDRKFRSQTAPILKSGWIQATWYGVLLGITLLMIWSSLDWLQIHDMLHWSFIVAVWRAYGLRYSVFGTFALLLWAIMIGACSAWKLIAITGSALAIRKRLNVS